MRSVRWLVVGMTLLLLREQPAQEVGPFEVYASTMMQDVLPLSANNDGPHYISVDDRQKILPAPNCYLTDNPLKGAQLVMFMDPHPDDQYTSYIRTPYRATLIRGHKTHTEGVTRFFRTNVEERLVKRCVEQELGR